MSNTPLTPQFLQLFEIDSAALAQEAAAGLLAAPAALSPKFFYDALGSRLFDAITELPEYYPTRTEAAIFTANADKIAQRVQHALPQGFAMVDLGAGNCAKAAKWFGRLKPNHYIAVDISVDFMRDAVLSLQRQHPSLPMTAVGMDFSTELALPPGTLQGHALVFYPGSSIGNFHPEQALRLMQQACALAAGGAVLIGVDLRKDSAVLELAYDDPLGVTAAFNLNLLRHVNQLLGTNFDVRDWRHVGLFNDQASRIEMHLEARRALSVRWPGGERVFQSGERMHTENSYKWRRADFEALLQQAGFRQVRSWTDERQWFAVMLASQ